MISKQKKANYIVIAWWISILLSNIPFFSYSNITNKIVWIIVLLSLFYMYKTIVSKEKKQSFVLSFTILFIVLLSYAILHLLFGRNMYIYNLERIVPKTEYLVGILTSFTPFYLCCYFFNKGYVSKHNMRLYSILFLISAIVEFFFFRVNYLIVHDVDSVTNNIADSFTFEFRFFDSKSNCWR